MPLFQLYVEAPLPVRVVGSPTQIVEGLALAITFGGEFTVTFIVEISLGQGEALTV